jgi:hypothetical protein
LATVNLVTDSDGNVIMRPLVGWTTYPVYHAFGRDDPYTEGCSNRSVKTLPCSVRRDKFDARGTAMPLIDECEVKAGKTWETIGISEALERRGDPMRCKECHGGLVPHKKYSTGARAHFEHHKAHSGCSTKKYTFSGVKSLHPEALV